MFDEMALGEINSLGKTMNTLVKPEEYSVIMNEGVQIVLDEDVIRNESVRYGNKFGAGEVGAKEEIDDVEVCKAGICTMVVTIGNNSVKVGPNSRIVASAVAAVTMPG